RYIFPMAFAIGFLIMTSAYFLMYHVFHAQGVVSVIIELFGGIIFLTIVLRKRAL
ncbi:TPA: iron ABC transporter permease, partial [Bacillus anthracis]|nr:iron ABC transporter permease [Bacillus anthracis]